ncbi:MAG: hypothetical protein DMG17_18600 [Acidobacteria bacterium]|nr:MAG: hypothetical protein DMG17_18600 [Acidobacteriota bacterium]
MVPPDWLRLMVSRRTAKEFRALKIPFPEKFKHIAMKIIRAGFCNEADRTPRICRRLRPL